MPGTGRGSRGAHTTRHVCRADLCRCCRRAVLCFTLHIHLLLPLLQLDKERKMCSGYADELRRTKEQNLAVVRCAVAGGDVAASKCADLSCTQHPVSA